MARSAGGALYARLEEVTRARWERWRSTEDRLRRRGQDPGDAIEQVVRRHERRREHEHVAADAAEQTARDGLGVNARADLLFGRERRPRVAILDELDRAHEPRAANLAHVRMIGEASRE